MKLIWLGIAAIAIIAATVLSLHGNFEAAFVVATVGVIAWFLNYRSQLLKK